QLIRLLEVMKEKKVVHGDFRPVNIMVRESTGETGLEVKVIDFDWSGICGEARYPLVRNLEIEWPGRAEELIGADDDGILLSRTLQ
ncbi:hypothetical protein CPB86DRAFT_704246, partial [Serendipita vermifera]